MRTETNRMRHLFQADGLVAYLDRVTNALLKSLKDRGVQGVLLTAAAVYVHLVLKEYEQLSGIYEKRQDHSRLLAAYPMKCQTTSSKSGMSLQKVPGHASRLLHRRADIAFCPG